MLSLLSVVPKIKGEGRLCVAFSLRRPLGGLEALASLSVCFSGVSSTFLVVSHWDDPVVMLLNARYVPMSSSLWARLHAVCKGGTAPFVLPSLPYLFFWWCFILLLSPAALGGQVAL
jgi:hypothetical protein